MRIAHLITYHYDCDDDYSSHRLRAYFDLDVAKKVVEDLEKEQNHAKQLIEFTDKFDDEFDAKNPQPIYSKNNKEYDKLYAKWESEREQALLAHCKKHELSEKDTQYCLCGEWQCITSLSKKFKIETLEVVE